MGKVIVDQTIRAKLGNLQEWLEFCDESGQVLGYFTPTRDPSLYAGMASEEELDRREKETEWYTTAEVLKHLENL